jgi:ABC-type transporter Mla MlaB component
VHGDGEVVSPWGGSSSMPSHLVFSIHHDARVATVWLSGALTLDSGASLRIALESLVAAHHPVALDVTGLLAIDAMGEAILAECVADALWRGSDVSIRLGDAPAWSSLAVAAR